LKVVPAIMAAGRHGARPVGQGENLTGLLGKSTPHSSHMSCPGRKI
jgi:hypothetical protein